MPKFKDKNGIDWTVEINIGTIKAVRSDCEVDLLGATDGKLIEKLLGDMVLFVDVLYVICREQCENQNVSDEDFGRGLLGDALENATIAFLEALTNFFPKDRRVLIRKALDKREELNKMTLEVLGKKLDDPKLMEKARAKLAEIGNLSFDLQGLSDSTPTPSQ